MSLTDKQREALQSSIPANAVTQRKQAGQMLDYVEGWWVCDRLNTIIGNGEWGSELATLELVSVVEADGKYDVTYKAIVRLSGPFVSQTGVGFATNRASKLGDAHETAGKSAETDALKRAAVKLGRHLWLALYEKPAEDGSRSGVEGPEAPLVAAFKSAATVDQLSAAKDEARRVYRTLNEDSKARLIAAQKAADERVINGKKEVA